jgi:hypothetical protein
MANRQSAARLKESPISYGSELERKVHTNLHYSRFGNDAQILYALKAMNKSF